MFRRTGIYALLEDLRDRLDGVELLVMKEQLMELSLTARTPIGSTVMDETGAEIPYTAEIQAQVEAEITATQERITELGS